MGLWGASGALYSGHYWGRVGTPLSHPNGYGCCRGPEALGDFGGISTIRAILMELKIDSFFLVAMTIQKGVGPATASHDPQPALCVVLYFTVMHLECLSQMFKTSQQVLRILQLLSAQWDLFDKTWYQAAPLLGSNMLVDIHQHKHNALQSETSLSLDSTVLR